MSEKIAFTVQPIVAADREAALQFLRKNYYKVSDS